MSGYHIIPLLTKEGLGEVEDERLESRGFDVNGRAIRS